jgi:hypothetical protein
MYHSQLKGVFGASYVTMGGMNSLNLESVNVGEYASEVPLNTLLFLYLCRRDLQRRFPEVFEGNLMRFTDWAFGVASGVRWDIDNKTLAPFGEYYETLGGPLIATRARRNLNSYLIGKGIQMFYRICPDGTRHIDRMCPDGTLRGRLRMIATVSVQTIREEGFRRFVTKVKLTLQQREFPIQ